MDCLPPAVPKSFKELGTSWLFAEELRVRDVLAHVFGLDRGGRVVVWRRHWCRGNEQKSDPFPRAAQLALQRVHSSASLTRSLCPTSAPYDVGVAPHVDSAEVLGRVSGSRERLPSPSSHRPGLVGLTSGSSGHRGRRTQALEPMSAVARSYSSASVNCAGAMTRCISRYRCSNEKSPWSAKYRLSRA